MNLHHDKRVLKAGKQKDKKDGWNSLSNNSLIVKTLVSQVQFLYFVLLFPVVHKAFTLVVFPKLLSVSS